MRKGHRGSGGLATSNGGRKGGQRRRDVRWGRVARCLACVRGGARAWEGSPQGLRPGGEVRTVQRTEQRPRAWRPLRRSRAPRQRRGGGGGGGAQSVDGVCVSRRNRRHRGRRARRRAWLSGRGGWGGLHVARRLELLRRGAARGCGAGAGRGRAGGVLGPVAGRAGGGQARPAIRRTTAHRLQLAPVTCLPPQPLPARLPAGPLPWTRLESLEVGHRLGLHVGPAGAVLVDLHARL